MAPTSDEGLPVLGRHGVLFARNYIERDYKMFKENYNSVFFFHFLRCLEAVVPAGVIERHGSDDR